MITTATLRDATNWDQIPGILGNLLMCLGGDELRLELSIDIVYSPEVSS